MCTPNYHLPIQKDLQQKGRHLPHPSLSHRFCKETLQPGWPDLQHSPTHSHQAYLQMTNFITFVISDGQLLFKLNLPDH